MTLLHSDTHSSLPYSILTIISSLSCFQYRIILGFAVVTPMTSTLAMAFRRREQALYEISRVRSFSFQIYLAHALWDWPEHGGRAGCTNMNWLEHCDYVMAQLIGIGDELCRFLSLPTSSRSRHRMTRSGRREAARTVKVSKWYRGYMHSEKYPSLTLSYSLFLLVGRLSVV